VERCAWEITVRTSKKQALIAIQRNPAVLARFWSQVERPENEHACWPWRGQHSRDGYASFRVGSTSIAAARVAWLCSTGEFPLGGRVHRRCRNRLCVRPSHLLWVVGSMMERRVRAESDGYVTVSGAKLFTDDPPRDWSRSVRITGIDVDSAPELPRSVPRQSREDAPRVAFGA
jgi:hypothetical protein